MRKGDWTDAEVETLCELYKHPDMTPLDIAQEISRSVGAVTNKASKLGITHIGKPIRKDKPRIEMHINGLPPTVFFVNSMEPHYLKQRKWNIMHKLGLTRRGDEHRFTMYLIVPSKANTPP